MVRVRFAPSPTGSLHLGGALTAVANRRFVDEHDGELVLRIDDTDPARVVPGSEDEILAELAWLGIGWDEGPVRQSERSQLYEEAAARLLRSRDAFEEGDGAVRFPRGRQRPTLVRGDGRATYHLASVVDDLDLGITHVIRGKDLLPSMAIHKELARALGAEPPEYLHHGLLVGPDGRKLSKRTKAASIAGLRELGIPAEAIRAYLAELDLPRGDVRFDETRLRRLAVEAIAALSDDELADRAGVARRLAPVLRGAHDLAEARALAEQITATPALVARGSPETLARFRELRAATPDDLSKEEAKTIVRELKAVGGDLRALRVALTGAERGPELWAVLVALPREEALARAAATG
jgi:glutamyl/glutaminyl-tRNA synthetase